MTVPRYWQSLSNYPKRCKSHHDGGHSFTIFEIILWRRRTILYFHFNITFLYM